MSEAGSGDALDVGACEVSAASRVVTASAKATRGTADEWPAVS